MIRGLLITVSLISLLGASSWAHEADTVSVNKIVRLEAQLDSLLLIISSLDSELQSVKQEIVEGRTDVDELIALLNVEDLETAPEDQRSRRKRVDALLKAITQRPGRLRFNGGATATVQGSPDKDYRSSTGVGSFDIFAHTAFGPNTILFIDLEAVGGNGPDDLIPTLSGLNDDARSVRDEDSTDRVTVLEAWAEFSVLKEIFTVTAGQIDLTNYFDNNASANDETMQFISSAFVNSAAFAVPGNSPGMRLRTTLFHRFYLQFGVASSDNSGKNLLDDLYKIGSVGFRVFPYSDWEANLRVYSFQHPSTADAYGFGLSFDEMVFGAYNVFARYGTNQAELADWYGITSAWSAGMRLVKHLAGRTTVLGFAYGEVNPRAGNLNNEKLMEMYARYQLNKWVHVSPHLQMVWNPAGSSGHKTIVGLRTQFNF